MAFSVSSPPFQAVQTLESHHQREQRFLSRLSLVLLAGYALSLPSSIWQTLSLGQKGQWFTIILVAVGLGVCWFGFRCSRREQSVRLGSWTIIGYSNIVLYSLIVLSGAHNPTPVSFLTTIILGLFLLPWPATVGFSFVAACVTISVFLLEENGYHPPMPSSIATDGPLALGIWVLLFLLPIILCAFMIAQLKRAYSLALDQNAYLQVVVADIAQKRQAEQYLSGRIKGVTTELIAPAVQQASGSQQQVAALHEVTESLSRLTTMAETIAIKSEDINTVAQNIEMVTQQARAANQTVVETGQRGMNAVESTARSNAHVRSQYQSLAQILSTLLQYSGEMRSILGMMAGLTAEMQLLALNAAIESVGAQRGGQRFGVVAREIKALAERSEGASHNVRRILRDIEQKIRQAVMTAESVLVQMDTAERLSRESGSVIRELTVAIEQSTTHVAGIDQVVRQALDMSLSIQDATRQQYAVASQAADATRGIGTIAQQSASGSSQLRSTAHDLEDLAQGLTTALVA